MIEQFRINSSDLYLDIDGVRTIGDSQDSGRLKYIQSNAMALGDLIGHVDQQNVFPEIFLEGVWHFIQDHCCSVNFLMEIKVGKDMRGRGLGNGLMEALGKEVWEDDFSFLFARVEIPQKEGFNLEKFYNGFGYEGLIKMNGDLLMARTNHLPLLRGYLGLPDRGAITKAYKGCLGGEALQEPSECRYEQLFTKVDLILKNSTGTTLSDLDLDEDDLISCMWPDQSWSASTIVRKLKDEYGLGSLKARNCLRNEM
ncbi:hypothetical protein [Neptuniibacter sp. QD37_11]|uniref:hypothetical protein n=1 Tax=Neptuniibacter sp. QD37_11 TaxID=3398209 RepID=UPI0039F51A31